MDGKKKKNDFPEFKCEKTLREPKPQTDETGTSVQISGPGRARFLTEDQSVPDGALPSFPAQPHAGCPVGFSRNVRDVRWEVLRRLRASLAAEGDTMTHLPSPASFLGSPNVPS